MSNLIREQMGARIKQLRLEQGMTQEELARETGVGIRNIQRWEKGLVTPYYRNILAMAGALSVAPEDILGISKSETEESTIAKLGREIAALQARIEQMTAWQRDTQKVLDELRKPDVRF